MADVIESNQPGDTGTAGADGQGSPTEARPGETGATGGAAGTADGTFTMRVWRGDADGGEFRDYELPASEGEVVLDVIHRIQAGPAPDLACRWNCKAGKCGSCSAEINGTPRPHVHDPDGLAPGGPGDGRPHAHVPDHPGPRDRRQLQLRDGQARARFRPAAAPRGGLPDATGRHRARPGIPQVHRVLHVPERLPRHPGPRGQQAALRGPPLLHPLRGARDAPARHERPSRAPPQAGRASATATSPSAAPRSARSTSRSPTTASSR